MDPGNIIPMIVKSYIISVVLTLLIILVSLPYINISWHTAGVSSLIALMYVYLKSQMSYNIWIVPTLFLILGIVATSRLILEQHSEREIYLGSILGFVSTFLMTIYF